MNKKYYLKILQISPTSYNKDSVIGGGEKIVLYIDKSLHIASQKNNINIKTAIVSLNGIPFKKSNKTFFDSFSVPGKEWDINSIDKVILSNIISNYQIIYIHQALNRIGFSAAALAQLAGKIVIGVDSGAEIYNRIKENDNFYKLFDAFHAYSDFAKKFLKNKYTPCYTIKGPIDTEYYDKKTLSIKGKRYKNILSIGRILPHKGFERLIRAVSSNIEIKIIGSIYDNDYYTFLLDLAKGKKIKFLTGLSDRQVKEELSKAALYVHPSTNLDYKGNFHSKAELLGLAPLEALSMGCPTFVSNTCALGELTNIKGCFIFNNEEELSLLINRFFSNTMEIPNCEEIHQSTTELYGIEQFGNKLLNLFLELYNENTCYI